MAEFKNLSGGSLILPDGTEIKAGASAEVSDKDLKVPGVSQWVDAGWLVGEKPKVGRPPKPIETKGEKE